MKILNAEKIDKAYNMLKVPLNKNGRQVLDLLFEHKELRSCDIEEMTLKGGHNFLPHSSATRALEQLHKRGWLKSKTVNHRNYYNSVYYRIDYNQIEKINKVLNYL